LTWPVALTTVQHYRADCDGERLAILNTENIKICG